MFYSNQLLSRKGPFGQIWIAATMHTKINRRKAEQIDIPEICEQILNPVVPLALRLSGILMGGVVLIYDRKVRFFSEDVKNLLIQIKLISATKKQDKTSLPKEKTQARFEAITIEYGFDDVCNEIERLMLQPNVMQPDDLEMARANEEFFFIPASEGSETSKTDQRFQVAQDRITIQEEIMQAEVLIRNENDDRIPPPDDMILDHLMPEYQQDELPPEFNIALAEEVQQSTVQGSNPNKNSEFPSPCEGSPEHKRTRTRTRRRRKRSIIDLDFIEVPNHEFRAWLGDAEDICQKRQKIRKLSKVHYQDTVHKLFSLPTSSLSWSNEEGIIAIWATPILELWNLLKEPIGTSATETDVSGETLIPELPRLRKRPRGTEEIEQPQHQRDNDMTHNQFEAPEIQDYIQDNGEEVALKYADFGSVEKLRSVLNTPNTRNIQDEFLVNQLGIISPRLSGQSAKSRGSFRMSTPASGRLSLDKDVELSRRASSTRKSSVSGLKSPGLDLQIDDYLKETITTNFEPAGDGGLIGATLSQFVLEETWPSQENLNPNTQNIDRITTSLIQILRERFTQAPKSHLSSEELTSGLDRSHAAKLFYHLCVMASSQVVSVEQSKPYGCIFIRRGVYM